MSIAKHQLRDAATVIDHKFNVYICGASFENRCRSLADALNPCMFTKAFVGVNENLLPYVKSNSEYLLGKFGAAAERVAMSSSDPLLTANSWMNALKKADFAPRRFLIDTTTFTHESLLILLGLLRQAWRRDDRCSIAYVSAKDYDASRNGADKWLSEGVEEVRSVLGYTGEILPSLKTHLMILVGFEHERASRLIEVFEPNRVSLGYGSPGSETDQKHAASNKRFVELAGEMAARYAPVETFEFPCSDPWAAKEAVLRQRQRQRHESYNTVVAPMNTKLSTIGCAMAAWQEPGIQLCYAQASQYNYANYSTPSDSFYLAEFPELRSALDAAQ